MFIFIFSKRTETVILTMLLMLVGFFLLAINKAISVILFLRTPIFVLFMILAVIMNLIILEGNKKNGIFEWIVRGLAFIYNAGLDAIKYMALYAYFICFLVGFSRYLEKHFIEMLFLGIFLLGLNLMVIGLGFIGILSPISFYGELSENNYFKIRILIIYLVLNTFYTIIFVGFFRSTLMKLDNKIFYEMFKGSGFEYILDNIVHFSNDVVLKAYAYFK